MTTLSYLRHTKQFVEGCDEVELFVDDIRFYVRVKYHNMETSTLYTYKTATEARFKYTQICLFVLS